MNTSKMNSNWAEFAGWQFAIYDSISFANWMTYVEIAYSRFPFQFVHELIKDALYER